MAGSNIIINYLPADANEEEIKDLFEAFGKVNSVRLIRNKQTGASLCYGFVIMENDLEAQVAIDALNQKTLRDKVMKVSRAKTKEEVARGGDNTNVYVTNVCPEVDSDILSRGFSKYGPIVSTHIVKNRDPTQKGVAFVKFFERDDADRAIKEQNGKPLCIRSCEDRCLCTEIVNVKFAIPSSAKFQKQVMGQVRPGMPGMYSTMPVNMISALPPANGPLSQTTLPNYGYATGHLQTFINPSTINSYFSPVPQNYQYSYPYQYPYVYGSTQGQTAQTSQTGYQAAQTGYQTSQASQNPYQTNYQSGYQTAYQTPYQTATASMTAAPIPMSTTPVSLDANPNIAVGTHCVFVYGLAQATTEEELQALFLPYGAISNCRLSYEISDGKRSCKGYGFVNYYSFNDAQLAIAGLNNYNYKGNVLQVRFKSSKGGKG